MTKAAAIYQFFSGFGIHGYPETSVPDGAAFPYLTYELVTSPFEDGEVSMTVNLWYRTTSESAPNAKAQELSDAIGRGGVLLPCDGGYVWLKRGRPWCRSAGDDNDPVIKRRVINVYAEYLTKN